MKHRLTLLTWAALLALAGCASPGSTPSALQPLSPQAAGLPTASAAAETTSPAGEVTPSPVEALSLGDARLAALLRQALAEHPSQAAARARVQRAQALAGQRQASDGPQVGLSVDLARQRYTENGLVPAPVAGSVWNSGTLQIGASWSPDFFGEHAAALAAAVGQARAAQADQAATALVLGEQVAGAYVQVARLLAQREVLDQQRQQREDVLALLRQRVQAGVEDRLALSPAEVAVHDVSVQRAALDEALTLTRHQLAVLCGQAPQTLDALAPSLDALHLPTLPTQLAADLLGRRPDVVAARWRAEAATQDVAVARAQFYPNVNLGAFVGLNALGLDRLLESGSRQMGVAPALRLPLFDGGRLRAQLGARQAERDDSVAQYNAKVLDAVREAADGLGRLNSLAAQQSAQRQAQQSADEGLALAQQRYRAGLGNRLAALNAQTSVLAQRQQARQLQANHLSAGLGLIRALGGGWQDEFFGKMSHE